MKKHVLYFILLLSTYANVLAQEKKYDELFNAGDQYYGDKEYISALDNYIIILTNLNNSKDENLKVQIWDRIGNTYLKLYEYTKALECFFEELKIAEKLNDVNLVIKTNIKIGNAYYRLGVYDKGIEKSKFAFELFEKHKIKDSILLASLFSGQGVFYGDMKQYKLSREYFNKALNIFIKYNKDKQIASTYINLGTLLGLEGQYIESIKKSKKSIIYWKNLNNEYKEAISNTNIAWAFSKLKIMDSSYYYNDKAYKKLIELKNVYNLKYCYEIFSEIEEHNGNYKKSLRYYKLQQELKDSLLNAKQIEKSLKLQSDYTINIINEKNTLKSEIQKSHYNAKIQLWVFISIFLALISFMLFLLFNNTKKTKSLAEINLQNSELNHKLLAQEVNLKNNKLSELSSLILSKNEVLNQLKESLKKLKKEQQIETTHLVKDISQQINLENERKELEVFINEQHTEFYFKLKQLHPDLSVKELRLSSLILTGLSSKEIATLLNITSKSIDMSRYRLRKKLNIPSKKSIAIFLSEL